MKQSMPKYDALLLVSFGGPEAPDEVMPFLENVTRGRGVPRERLEAVAEHYMHFGGKSPINAQNRELIAALQRELARSGPKLPIYFGNRNWHPMLHRAIEQMRDDGVHSALALVTSAYSSYSGCRQYREDIEKARESVEGAPHVEPLRRFFNHPGFVDACTDRVQAALTELGAAPAGAPPPRIAFTAHSIPLSMASSCDYRDQLEANAELISERVGVADWDVVWQSRSGPPHVPWLEPDILDHLRALRERGTRQVVVAPIGFLSDHLEVLYDLDVEARALAEELGLSMARAGTAGTHPRLVEGLVQLVRERTEGAPLLSVGRLPARPVACAADCCPPPVRPRPGAPRPGR